MLQPFKIVDKKTGKVLTVYGDAAPTEQDQEELFDAYEKGTWKPSPPPKPFTITDEKTKLSLTVYGDEAPTKEQEQELFSAYRKGTWRPAARPVYRTDEELTAAVKNREEQGEAPEDVKTFVEQALKDRQNERTRELKSMFAAQTSSPFGAMGLANMDPALRREMLEAQTKPTPAAISETPASGQIGDIGMKVAVPLAVGIATRNPLAMAAAGGGIDMLVQQREEMRGEPVKSAPVRGTRVLTESVLTAINPPALKAGTGVAQGAFIRGAQTGAMVGAGELAQQVVGQATGQDVVDIGEVFDVATLGAMFGGAFGVLETAAPAIWAKVSKKKPSEALEVLRQEPKTPEVEKAIESLQQVVQQNLPAEQILTMQKAELVREAVQQRAREAGEQIKPAPSEEAARAFEPFEGVPPPRPAKESARVFEENLDVLAQRQVEGMAPRPIDPAAAIEEAVGIRPAVAAAEVPQGYSPAAPGVKGQVAPGERVELTREARAAQAMEAFEKLPPQSRAEESARILEEAAMQQDRAIANLAGRMEENFFQGRLGSEETSPTPDMDRVRKTDQRLAELEKRPGKAAKETARVEAQKAEAMKGVPAEPEAAAPAAEPTPELSPQAQAMMDRYGGANVGMLANLATGGGGFVVGWNTGEGLPTEERLKRAIAFGAGGAFTPTAIRRIIGMQGWANRVIKERGVGSGSLNTADPQILAALSVKGAALVGEGVKNFAEWGDKMVREFGDSIRPKLKEIWAAGQESDIIPNKLVDKAPERPPRQYETPEFKTWFGKSKVVNEDGTPKVMYHGASDVRGANALIGKKDFTVFKPNRQGLIFVTPEGGFAGAMAGSKNERSRVYPLYVKAENIFDYTNPEHIRKIFGDSDKIETTVRSVSGKPVTATIRKANVEEGDWFDIEFLSSLVRKAGFDGLYVLESGYKNLAVFDPNQLKSATGNRGTFSLRDRDIRGISTPAAMLPLAQAGGGAVAGAAMGETPEEKLRYAALGAAAGAGAGVAMTRGVKALAGKGVSAEPRTGAVTVSKKVDIPTEKELKDAADSQRGAPETQMLRSQRAITDAGGPAIYADALEHIGDLAHRVQEPRYLGSGGAGEKIQRFMRVFFPGKNRMSFEQELEEGLRGTAEYRVIKKHPELEVEGEPRWMAYEKARTQYADEIKKNIAEGREEMIRQGREYAKVHLGENKPVTYAGKLGRDAAIALGEMNFSKLRNILSELNDFYGKYADTPEIYSRQKPAAAPAAAEAPKTPQSPTQSYETPNFKAWFKNSQVVNEDGTPRRMYHGTTKNNLTKFDQRSGGIWVAFDPAAATPGTGEEAGSVIPLFVSAQKVYKLSPDEFKKWRMSTQPKKLAMDILNRERGNGYDAVQIEDYALVVAKPTQVKSAVSNSGAYSGMDPRIAGYITKQLAIPLGSFAGGFTYGFIEGAELPPDQRLINGLQWAAVAGGIGYAVAKRSLNSINGERVSEAAAKKLAPDAVTGDEVLEKVRKTFTPDPTELTKEQKFLTTPQAKLLQAFQNVFRPLSQVEEALVGRGEGVLLGDAASMVAGAVGKAEAALYLVQENQQKLIPQISKETLNDYLFLRRVVDRLTDRPDIGKFAKDREVAGYTLEQGRIGLDAIRKRVGDEDFIKLEEFARVVQASADEDLKLMVRSGRMSDQAYNEIKTMNEFYAPFYVMEYFSQMDGATEMLGKGALDTTQPLTKAIKGIKDEDFKLLDIMTGFQINKMRAQVLADKNNVMRRMAELSRVDTEHRFMKDLGTKMEAKYSGEIPKGWEVVNYMEDGVKKQIAVLPEVAQAVKGMDTVRAGAFMTALASFASPLRAGATGLNAGFQIVNVFKDAARMGIMSKYGIEKNPVDFFTFVGDLLVGATHSVRSNLLGDKSQLYLDFLKSGAARSTLAANLVPDALARAAQQGDDKLAASILKVPLRSFISGTEKFGNAIEESIKLAGFRRGVRSEGLGKLTGKAYDDALERIAYEIRNYAGSPDFSKHGTHGKALNVLFMFANARIQGTAADLRRIIGRTGEKERNAAVVRLAAGIGTATGYLWYLNQQPENVEDYNKRSLSERNAYFLWPRYTETGDPMYYINEEGQKVREYLRFPKFEVVGMMANVLDAGLNYAAKRDPKGIMEMGKVALENLSPIPITGRNMQERIQSIASGLNPVFKAPLEIATNKSFFQHRDIVKQRLQGVRPEEQYLETTPKPFIDVARAMPEVAPDFLRSPLYLKQLTENFTGSMVTQFMRPQLEGRSSATTNPLVARFFAAPILDEQETWDQINGLKTEQSTKNLLRQRAIDQYIKDSASYTPAQRMQSLGQLLASDPERNAAAMYNALLDRNRGVTDVDRAVRSLEPQFRAQFLEEKVRKMETKEQRDAFYREMILKGIINDKTLEEILKLRTAPEGKKTSMKEGKLYRDPTTGVMKIYRNGAFV